MKTEKKAEISIHKIDDSIYSKLPVILKEITENHHIKGEKTIRDAILISSLTTIGATIAPFISCLYDGKKKHPNLFCWIIAPAASGKGEIEISRDMVSNIHETRLKEFEKEFEIFSLTPKGKHGSVPFPKQRGLFIPGNTTSAAIYKTLADYDGTGLIFETEADTLSQALNNTYGHFTDVLRSAYEHETVSANRKGDGRPIIIKNPKLSIVLSSTPNQLRGVISNIENGLMSRFLFYLIKDNSKWKNISQSGSIKNLGSLKKELSQKCDELLQFYTGRDVEVIINEKELDLLNQKGEYLMKYYDGEIHENFISIIKRNMQTACRVAFILSAIRYFSENVIDDKIVVTTEEMEISLEIVTTCLKHAEYLFEKLGKTTKIEVLKNQEKLLNALPVNKTFTRSEAVELTKDFCSTRTCDKLLEILSQNDTPIKKIKHGEYIINK